jgi:hypothetical protein
MERLIRSLDRILGMAFGKKDISSSSSVKSASTKPLVGSMAADSVTTVPQRMKRSLEALLNLCRN